jgi:two-component system cell cycle response regulator DivK
MSSAIILHVEDNEDNRQIVRDLFEHMGYTVIEAVDGEEGVSKAKEHKPHIILMDIQLPKMTGYETTRAIKSDPDLKDIPIIVITSYALSGDDQKAYEAGADDYLAKPYKPKDLLNRVETWLERKSNG